LTLLICLSLEEGKEALLFASGMAAATTVFQVYICVAGKTPILYQLSLIYFE